jgi:hypothetical protein
MKINEIKAAFLKEIEHGSYPKAKSVLHNSVLREGFVNK